MWSLTHEVIYEWLKNGSAEYMRETIFKCLFNLGTKNIMSLRDKPFRKHQGSEGNLLYFALRYKNQQLFNELMRKCALYELSFKVPCYINGDTILHTAVRYRVIDFVRFSCYIDPIYEYVNLRNYDHETPLHVACQLGYKDVIKYLLKRCYSHIAHIDECIEYCITHCQYDVMNFVFDIYSQFFTDKADFQRYLRHTHCNVMRQQINKYNPYLLQ